MTCKDTIFLLIQAYFTPFFLHKIKNRKFALEMLRTMQFVDIHTHRPTGVHIEPRSFGIHPWDSERFNPDEISAHLANTDVVGEIGLDFACRIPHDVQVKALRAQLQTAAKTWKPVVLHCVRAFEPMMKILNNYRLRAVIFHGFIGSEQQAARAVANGYWLSFGPMTFRSPKTVRALQAVPLQNLFLETDDSGIAIETVYSLAAEAKGLTVEQLKVATFNNYTRIFDNHE